MSLRLHTRCFCGTRLKNGCFSRVRRLKTANLSPTCSRLVPGLFRACSGLSRDMQVCVFTGVTTNFRANSAFFSIKVHHTCATAMSVKLFQDETLPIFQKIKYPGALRPNTLFYYVLHRLSMFLSMQRCATRRNQKISRIPN